MPSFHSQISSHWASFKVYQRFFVIVMLILFCLFPLLSLHYGITWDEWMQGYYGKLVWRFYLTGGSDNAHLTFTDSSFLYGGFFDVLTGFVYSVLFENLKDFAFSGLHDTLLGKSFQDIAGSGFYETRHVLNALFGALAILFTGLCAKELRSWRAACIAVFLIVLSPRFFGHSMNNPKDIPFATSYIMTLYALIRILKSYPVFKRGTILLLIIGLGMALGIRIGAALLFFYTVLFLLIRYGLSWKQKLPNPDLKGLAVVVLALTGGYFLGLIFWPYGLTDPLFHPWSALKTFSNFTGASSDILFEGRYIPSSDLPWYYIPKWIVISSPPAFLLGLIAGIFLLPKRLKRPGSLLFWVILAGAFFPLVSVILKKSVLYDGWRHLLFIYPPLIIIASLGWDHTWETTTSQNQKAGILVAGVLVLLQLQVFFWMVKNHPNEYVYFNFLAGGPGEAQGRYETDYWGNCLRESSEWIGHYHQVENPDRTAVIYSEGDLMSTYPYLKKILADRYIPYKQIPAEIRQNVAPHYAILLARRPADDALLKGQWPPPNTLHEVKADGATLCAVIKGPAAQ